MLPFTQRDTKIIGAITLVSGILAAGCLVAALIGANYDLDAFSDPAKLVTVPGVDREWVRWSMLLDMLGYYLLLLPVIFYVHTRLGEKTPWAQLTTSLGYGYVLTGAIGAAILAAVWPPLIDNFAHPDKTAHADFLLITDVVVKGMWNQLEVFFCGVWWIMTGSFVIKSRSLKITTLVLGVSCLIDAIGELMQWPAVAETGLTVYLILAIVWPVWTGISLMRRSEL